MPTIFKSGKIQCKKERVNPKSIQQTFAYFNSQFKNNTHYVLMFISELL